MSSPSVPRRSKPLVKARDYLGTLGYKLKRISRSASCSSSRASGSRATSPAPSPAPPLASTLEKQSPILIPAASQLVSIGTDAEARDQGPSLLSVPVENPPLQSANIRSVTAPAKPTPWSVLAATLQGLQKASEVFPPLHAATGALLSCLDGFESAATTREGYDDLALELRTMAAFLAQNLQEQRSPRLNSVITEVSELLRGYIEAISEKQKRSFTRRFLAASEQEEELIRDYRRIEGLFRRLQMEVSMSAWSIANDQLVNTRLEGLDPAKMARFDSMLGEETHRRTCTERTREAVLSNLYHWSDDPGAKQIYWMNGMAGTGKTTIACTLAKELESRGQLGASFFCTRTSPECRDASRIVPTIAYQLARYSTPFRSALCEALDSDPDIGTRNIVTQFERLLKRPLQQARHKIPGNLVVVIDALDECDNIGAVRLVLETLLRFTTGLPIKFFVSSRPEPKVHDAMSHNESSRAVLHLHDIETSIVQADIRLYLQEELESFSELQITQLVELSNNLFIYAATAVRYIRSDEATADPEERLAAILDVESDSNIKHEGVDELYSTVLNTIFNNNKLEVKEKERIQLVLWAAVCAREPVPIETLTMLAGTGDDKHTLTALDPLQSVLHFSESNNLVSTLHASFPDYIFHRGRSRGYFCDEAIFGQSLARRCFETMAAHLQFNICQLETSFVFDKQVEDLGERIAMNISAPLAYACRYWADHLKSTTVSEELCAVLKEFLSVRLLFWMEVMNLKQWMSDGVGALSATQKWLTNVGGKSELRKWTSDAQVFVTRFVGASISLSTPHIYISALPLSSRSSELLQQYRYKTTGLIDARGTMIEQRDLAPLATWRTTEDVYAAAFSPDGTRIASGCRDGTIWVWDAINGTPIAGPLRGHTSAIFSIAFSQDGTRVVSGSEDQTVWIWDATNGTHVAGPFRGHTYPVDSVALSRDGTRIVYGAFDCTIRVWDTTDGTPVSSPFHGHTDPVTCVAFSPDGTRIVSGSANGTIRVWDATNGTPTAGPFKNHDDPVYTVTFSPDGTRIASGSSVGAIWMWDATGSDETPIAGPFEGHNGAIWSVAFSPDGMHIASCSYDRTIRLWETNGTPIAGPFQGHTGAVYIVAFSPDGTRIVTGSKDFTIRMWDATNRTLIADTSQGHTSFIYSVAFSPDGARIVSGSDDRTIRVWNATNGTLAVSPFRGHKDTVFSSIFSPDGACVVSGCKDGTICVWDAANGTPITGPFQGHTSAVRSVALSPDGARIASGSSDRTIRVWAATNGVLIVGPFRGHTDIVSSVAFSPDGVHIVSGSNDHTIRVWDATNGTPITGPLKGHNSIHSVAFSPDSARIVSGSENRMIQVWDATNGTPIADPFQGHTNAVLSVAFSPDGARIVSGSKDGTVRLWDATNRAPVASHDSVVSSVAFSPNGRYIVSGSYDGTILSHTLELTSLTPAACTGGWVVDDFGWFTNIHSELLFWIPQELRSLFSTPHRPLVITRQGSIYVVYDNILIGSRWHECYLEA
ncbi:Vegetative incompatibility protein HET-E-1 [Ceratobasidium theobromae]|uniref:Vegetative incompatibility protein HET-E-1 n=1 Tax=Ceratobasidium theobromae TaxID=1582974 RepID=A0A5N5QGB7_9AGAM|nr:Vegetative incompatibility protein HET-E-1 [Ceratobasidium theobromae]